jgi:ribosomal-protein-alanine N-acetyltransferase
MCGFCATVVETAVGSGKREPAIDFMPALEIATERLILSAPHTDRAVSMFDFARRNREHFAPWNPPMPDDFYSLSYWQEAVRKHQVAFDAGSAVRFWLAPVDEPERGIGSIGFTQIFRGAFCSCVLGYQIDREYEGRGLMHEALQVAIQYMFSEQKLHRIAANYRPENVRSGRLLAKLGFRIEGFAKEYLFIDGAWRDHILTSRVNDHALPALAKPG